MNVGVHKGEAIVLYLEWGRSCFVAHNSTVRNSNLMEQKKQKKKTFIVQTLAQYFRKLFSVSFVHGWPNEQSRWLGNAVVKSHSR